MLANKILKEEKNPHDVEYMFKKATILVEEGKAIERMPNTIIYNRCPCEKWDYTIEFRASITR